MAALLLPFLYFLIIVVKFGHYVIILQSQSQLQLQSNFLLKIQNLGFELYFYILCFILKQNKENSNQFNIKEDFCGIQQNHLKFRQYKGEVAQIQIDFY